MWNRILFNKKELLQLIFLKSFTSGQFWSRKRAYTNTNIKKKTVYSFKKKTLAINILDSFRSGQFLSRTREHTNKKHKKFDYGLKFGLGPFIIIRCWGGLQKSFKRATLENIKPWHKLIFIRLLAIIYRLRFCMPRQSPT